MERITYRCRFCGTTRNVAHWGLCDSHHCLVEELRELIRKAPSVSTLDSLWRHRKTAWTIELNELAAARKRELTCGQDLFGES